MKRWPQRHFTIVDILLASMLLRCVFNAQNYTAVIQPHLFLFVGTADTVICHFSWFRGLFYCVEAGGGFIFQQAKFKSKAEQGAMTCMKLPQIRWTSVSA